MQLLQGGAELGGRGEAPEALHRVTMLVDGPVIVLNPVGQVLIAVVSPLAPEDPRDCRRSARGGAWNLYYLCAATPVASDGERSRRTLWWRGVGPVG